MNAMRRRFAVLALWILVLAVAPARTGLGAQQGEKKAAPPPPPPLALKVGDMAPDFSLRDQTFKNKVSLHDYKGKKNVALAFYIFAFTGG
jgi:cytochrome oxidase Cu insertion factor (SCO1/SenC/PrrC family)